jgi:hypothetical protein
VIPGAAIDQDGRRHCESKEATLFMEGICLQRACLALVLLFASLTSIRPAAADDAPPPPPAPPIERLFAPAKEAMKDLPPFLRDTNLRLQWRSYYFNRENPEDGSENEAWAFGGWISYRSGWLFDVFGLGATFYGSAPLYAPDDRDGTLLLKPGQEGYDVLGEAYAALRYQDNILVRGYRQLVNQPYINPIDNRMTPNTFEGITAGGKVGVVEYFAGYLWKIKPRNEDDFIFMSQQAGAAGSDDGVILGRVQVTPLAGLRIDAAEQYGINTFNQRRRGLGCHQSQDAGERAGPAGVQPHRRRPSALAAAHLHAGLVAPRARRHPRSRGRRPTRLAGPRDPQLGARPLVRPLVRRISAWSVVVCRSSRTALPAGREAARPAWPASAHRFRPRRAYRQPPVRSAPFEAVGAGEGGEQEAR